MRYLFIRKDINCAHRSALTASAANVRLQARAARGASLCKPLFGGTHIRSALLRQVANGKV
jgi:hypothetical protein